MKTIKNLTADQIRKSILQLAIQGKLVKQDPNDEPASELVKRIYEEKHRLIKEGKIKKDKNESYIYKGEDNCYYEKVGSLDAKLLENIPFELPNGWTWIRQSNLCWLDNGNKTQSGELPYLEAKVIRQNKPDKYQTSGVVVDSNFKLILVDGENSGEIFTPPFKGYMGSTFKILDVTSEIDFQYLLLIFELNLDLYRNSKTGAAIPHLNKKLFKENLIALPPLNEQLRIVKKLSEFNPLLERYQNIEKELSSYESSFEEKLKASILQYAIEGKLVKQDPNDEPASKLLERIRTEKEKLIREGKIRRTNSDSEIVVCDDKNYYEKLELTLKDVCSYGNTCIKQPKSIFDLSLIELDQIISGDSTCPAGVPIKENKITSSKTYFEKGMILYSKLRPYLDKVILADKSGICSSELVPFWSYIPVNWLLLYLHSPLFIQRVNGDSFGVKMPRVKTSTFLNSKINLFSETNMLKTIIKVRKLFCLFYR